MATGIHGSDALEPPRLSVELQDPGAHDLDTSGDDEQFSDALEGKKPSSPRPQSPLSRTDSPVPRTRVQRVDDQPSHGEVPGLPAYEMRKEDAVPDELEIVSDPSSNKPDISASPDRSASPGGSPVPLMVVEKVDPAAASHGEVPGTAAYEQRLADATPDLVFKSPDPNMPRSTSPSSSPSATKSAPIPETIVTEMDPVPGVGEGAHASAPGPPSTGIVPGVKESEQAGEGSPTLERSSVTVTLSARRPLEPRDSLGAEGGLGDDFNDFEDGAQAGEDDDFGDFDDGLEGPAVSEDVSEDRPSLEEAHPQPPLPLLDFDALSSLPEITAAMQDHLDAIFPGTTSEKLAALPTPEPIPAESPVFPTERSRALWKQLITPPPLQPPNWTKSRIRRLFLVSLGVPVDLDEILPPSKQKKLVLPDMHLESATRKSDTDRTHGSISALKAKAANGSSASIDSGASSSSKSRRRHRGPAPPPDLDLGAVKRLCATTDEKLDGLTEAELGDHVREVQFTTGKTQDLLVYWLKRRDDALKEKEAFEGVIENLVRHARRVRN